MTLSVKGGTKGQTHHQMFKLEFTLRGIWCSHVTSLDIHKNKPCSCLFLSSLELAFYKNIWEQTPQWPGKTNGTTCLIIFASYINLGSKFRYKVVAPFKSWTTLLFHRLGHTWLVLYSSCWSKETSHCIERQKTIKTMEPHKVFKKETCRACD